MLIYTRLGDGPRSVAGGLRLRERKNDYEDKTNIKRETGYKDVQFYDRTPLLALWAASNCR